MSVLSLLGPNAHFIPSDAFSLFLQIQRIDSAFTMSLQAAIVPQTHSPFLSKEVHNARYPTTTATTVAGRLSALTLPGIMSSLISPDTTAVNVIQLSPTALAEEALRLSRETLNLEIQAYLPKVTGTYGTVCVSSQKLLQQSHF